MSNNQEIIEFLKFKFKTDILKVLIRFKNRIMVQVRPKILLDVASYLFKEKGFRYVIASAMDTGENYEIIYHFSNDATGLLLNIQVEISYDKPEIESMVPLFVAADWIEREIHELFGIKFNNHPDLKPLLSEGNWGKDEYPMRKEKKN